MRAQLTLAVDSVSRIEPTTDIRRHKALVDTPFVSAEVKVQRLEQRTFKASLPPGKVRTGRGLADRGSWIPFSSPWIHYREMLYGRELLLG